MRFGDSLLLAAGISNFIIGLYVIYISLKNKSLNKLVLVFLFNTFCLGLWMFDLLNLQISHNLNSMLFIRRFLRFGTLMIPFSFFWLVAELTGFKNKIIKFSLVWIGLTANIIFLLRFINIPQEKYTYINIFLPVPDLLMFIHSLNLVYAALLGIFFTSLLIFKEKNDILKKNRAKYLLLSVVLIISLGIIAYFVMLATNIKATFALNSGTIIITGILAYSLTKKNLAGIRVTIKKNVSYFLTILLIGVSFSLTCFYLNEHPWILAATTTLLGVLWALLAKSFQEFLITTATRVFVKGWYNPEQILHTLIKKISSENDRVKIFKIIENALDEGINFEKTAIMFAVRKNEDCLSYYLIHYKDEENVTKSVKIELNDPILEYFNANHELKRVSNLDEKARKVFENIKFPQNSLILPFHSPDMIEGMVILGERSSQIVFKQADYDFFSTIINVVSAVLFRLSPIEQVESRYFNTQKKLHEAEVQILRSKRNESLAHMRRQFCHELRTPLSVINLKINRLPENEETTPIKSGVLNEISHAMEIVQETLKLAGDEKIEDRVEEMIDINEAILRCLKLVPEYGFTVNKEFEKIPMTLGVFRDIQMVFTNLMKNSITAMPNGGIIAIKTYAKPKDIIIEFSDTGIGIPEENLVKIWEPYISGEQSDYGNSTGGRGWGLTIINRIIEEHLGHISVKSKINEGTIFTIRIPIRQV